MTVNWSAQALTNAELADELENRATDPDVFDRWVNIAVAHEAAKRLRVDHGAWHRESQDVPEKYKTS